MATVEVVHRNRFVAIPGATAKEIRGDAWEIRIPALDPIHGKTRRKPTPEGWDGAVFAIDGRETAPAVGSGTERDGVVVTVWVID